MSKAFGYKEAVTDDQLISTIEAGVANSSGDWLNSSDLARERQKSTYEYAGIPSAHLAPQGVSTIVDTSTTEVVEAYIAVLSDLFLNNGKIARFIPMDDLPGSYKAAREASMVTNYAIFKQNKGWEQIQTWMKSALLWKNGIIRWDYVEDFDYKIEEYERVDQAKLDMLLSDENVEIVGDLEFENETTMLDALGNGGETELVYTNVRLRRKTDKSRVKITNVPPENFRISRDASCIDEATFVGLQTDMTRSEIRKTWPDVADDIDDWDALGTDDSWTMFNEDIEARKMVTGQNYTSSHSDDILEANREVSVTECWIRVDRDGDGIAELKHFIVVGSHILHEEDCDDVPLASLSPIDIPFEFYGLSMADFTRSSTLASTAILRGFVENTYLTNYSPKLADPNVVDFSALQNMKPKQIIPTNGNPMAAVAPLSPDTISTGTVPLLQHLQIVKEQATGMSKAAQGLQDELFVSGNSEAKLSQVQSASQKRIQHIARRFAETGLKRLVQGVYSCMREHLQGSIKYLDGSTFRNVNIQELPRDMECEILLDLGENSNANRISKLQQVGQGVLPALNEAGAGIVIKPEAPAVLATKLIEAMGLDSNDFLDDYTTDEFKERAAQSIEEQTRMAMEDVELTRRKSTAEAALSEANVAFTAAQTKNTSDDNAKQLAVAIDRHHQEWADLYIKAAKEGIDLPARPEFNEIMMIAQGVFNQLGLNSGAVQQVAEAPAPAAPKPIL